MQTIMTKTLAPTNTKGTRIRVKTSGGGLNAIVPYDHEFGADENHRFAACQAAEKMGWHGEWRGGDIPGIRAATLWVCVDGMFNPRSNSFHI